MANTVSDVMRVQHGDEIYAVDINDLDGHEAGILSRFGRDHGNVGVVYATLLIGKRRAGEIISEADVLKIKVGEWENLSGEPDAGPPADAPAEEPPA
jgi:hypothetical protein